MFDLQTTVNINDKLYNIDTNFKTWIKFQEIFKINNDDEKMASLISFINKLGLPILKESLDAIIDFFVGRNNSNSSDSNLSNELHYDFKQDYEYIYSAFLEQYGIDLLEDNLHWHKFKALFSSLSSECMFSKIIHYRSINLDDVPKEQKNFYKKMKNTFALNKSNKKKLTTEEYHQSIIDKFNQKFKEVERWQTEQ